MTLSPRSKKLILTLNLLIYSVLFIVLGNSMHVEELKPLGNTSKLATMTDNTILMFQFTLNDMISEKQKFTFISSDEKYYEITTNFPQNTKNHLMLEVPANLQLKLVSVEIKDEVFDIENLSHSFYTSPNKVNYIGSMILKFKDEDLHFGLKTPKDMVYDLKQGIEHFKIDNLHINNAYTNKSLAKALEPSQLQLVYGNITDSFKDYVQSINQCYQNEWSVNPIVLGQLQFKVTEHDGILRVQNFHSEHSASKEFENCVWNSFSMLDITDKEFQVKMPGILYF